MDQTSRSRRTPALRLAAYVAAGVLFGRISSLPPGLLWTGVVAVAACVGLSWRRSGSSESDIPVLSALAALLCVMVGMARFSDVSHSVPDTPDSLLNTPVTVLGAVCDDPSVSRGRIRFTLAAREVRCGRGIFNLPARILVTMRSPPGRSDSLRLAYGMVVLLRGKLDRPSGVRNPGEFDARTYYGANGIALLLRVRSADSVVTLSESGGAWWMRSLVLPVRRFLIRHVDRRVGGDEGEFLKGILIGERSGLSSSLRESFTRSGTAHVLAVSGSNVAVLAGVVFLLLEFLRTGRRCRIALTCACIGFYMMLTGGQPPVLRAGMMAMIVLLAGIVQERPHTLNSLGVAAAAILLFDPRQLFDVGFQLSFAAVISIVLLFPVLNAWIDRLPGRPWLTHVVRPPLRLTALTVAATVGTLPLTAIAFGRVSIIGLLANIVVVPAVGVSVVLGVAAASADLINTWMAEAYASLNTVILRVTIATSEYAGGLSLATIETPGFRWVDAIAFYAAVGLLYRWWRRKRVFPAALLMLLALSASVVTPPPPAFAPVPGLLRITFLDVGQGDAAVLELPGGEVVVVDAGGWSPEYDAGERVVVPYLRRRAIRAIDLLVVTHGHGDHLGGAPALLRALPVRRVLQPPGGLSVMDSVVGGRQISGRRGMEVPVGPVTRLYILSPPPEPATSIGSQDAELNNTSVVLKVVYGSVGFLMAGDADVDAEAEMVQTFGDFLRSAVLKVGHHGSLGSSSEAFLDEVRPEYAVVSVGRGNVFSHPSAAVVARLASRGIETLRTDEEGAVIFETDGETLTRLEWK